MVCKKCGFQNNDYDKFCQKCGKPLVSSQKNKTALIIGIIAGGLVLIAAAIVVLLLLGGGVRLTGAWHNEELSQVLRFHEDNTVVIRTPYGDYEADYVFDKGAGKGVITLNGEAISFTAGTDSLLLMRNGTETAFARGDMEVAAATPNPTATTAPTSTPADTPTPTKAPTKTPSSTAKPSASPSGSTSFGPFPSISLPHFSTPPHVSVKPQVSVLIPGDIFGNLIGTSVLGDWYYTADKNYVLTFDANGGYTFSNNGSGIASTYTYDKSQGKGELSFMNEIIPFTVSGNTLTWKDGTTFDRG